MSVVTIADWPDLVPTVARWLWHELWRHDGYALEQTRAVTAASVARSGPPRTSAVLVGNEPVGTASLAAGDLDERPSLTPWLAGVFVVPEARSRGYATRLIGTVEAACQAAFIPAAWLYTENAERMHARARWRAVEIVQRQAKRPVILMRKDFKV